MAENAERSEHVAPQKADLEDPNLRSSEDAEGGADLASDAEVARVYRKLDLRIIPALWVLYFLGSAIRGNVGLSLTMNLSAGHSLGQNLHLTPHQISTGLALFYVGYCVFEVPANLVMSRMSPHAWMSRIVLAVGIVGACHAALTHAWNWYLIRLLLGIVEAGLWPGMSYYLTLFYPPSHIGKRIGYYFTAAQVSAAVGGLVSAGFQKMDGDGGLTGYKWMFLLYGLVTVVDGIALLWWIPDRPVAPGEERKKTWYSKFVPHQPPALSDERDQKVHYEELKRVYHPPMWTLKDLLKVFLDWRVWPLVIMYFGVVGVGIGVQNYGTLIIKATNPTLSGINLSLLFAPIWIMDLIAILLVTPISDRFHKHRALFFSVPVLLQITGLLVVSYGKHPWPRYVGLLIVGFGLGPTVPICMTWTNEIFQPRHGEVGVAAASALVSGLGNLGSVTTTYALYAGWVSDSVPGPNQYHKSNLVMIGILVLSILSSIVLTVLLKIFDKEHAPVIVLDRAAKRQEEVGERGIKKPKFLSKAVN